MTTQETPATGLSSVASDGMAAESDVLLQRPVIIVGAVRSGTTMLHLMLGGHPTIRMVGEFEESVQWLGDRGWMSTDEYRENLSIHRVFARRGIALPSSSDYPAAVGEIYRRLFTDLEPGQRPAFVVHSRFDRTPDLWPEATFIHIVRDPRDVARSCVAMGWAGHPWQASQTWVDAETRYDRLAACVPEERRIEVQYESLVRDPRVELARILDRIGLKWDEGVFDYVERSTYDAPDGKYAEQWKRKMSPREISLVESRCHSLMAARGYTSSMAETRGPGSLEAVSLYVRNRVRRWNFSRRRYGLFLALTRPIATRMPARTAFRRRVQASVNEIDMRHLK